jgi:hypothetical protein
MVAAAAGAYTGRASYVRYPMQLHRAKPVEVTQLERTRFARAQTAAEKLAAARPGIHRSGAITGGCRPCV